MARLLAALVLALFLSVGGVADLVDVQGEGCENGAVCPATSGERAGRAAVLQDTPSGEDIGVELLQSNKGRKELHPSVAALAAAVGTSVNGSLLAKAVSEALAKKGNVSMPSVQELKDSFRSRYQVRLANILSAAIEDSELPEEAKELVSKELRNTSSGMFVAFEATISKAEANGTLPDFANVTKLTMAGDIFDTLQDAFQKSFADQFEKKAQDIFSKAKQAAGGSAASTIKDTFGIDVNDLPFEIPGVTDVGSTLCSSTDTGGTCSWGGCSASRNSVCNPSKKCVCKSGDCAVGGKCGCSTDTGGTCFTSACSAWRGATCKSGSCVCASGQCATDGKCG